MFSSLPSSPPFYTPTISLNPKNLILNSNKLEKSISSILLGIEMKCRSTAFSWHFENNGWMNDSSLMILEVSIWCWQIAKSILFYLSAPPSLINFFIAPSLTPPARRSSQFLQMKTPTNTELLYKHSRAFTIYSSVTWYQLSYFFLHVWALSKANFLLFLCSSSNPFRWKTKKNKNLHRLIHKRWGFSFP